MLIGITLNDIVSAIVYTVTFVYYEYVVTYMLNGM